MIRMDVTWQGNQNGEQNEREERNIGRTDVDGERTRGRYGGGRVCAC